MYFRLIPNSGSPKYVHSVHLHRISPAALVVEKSAIEGDAMGESIFEIATISLLVYAWRHQRRHVTLGPFTMTSCDPHCSGALWETSIPSYCLGDQYSVPFFELSFLIFHLNNYQDNVSHCQLHVSTIVFVLSQLGSVSDTPRFSSITICLLHKPWKWKEKKNDLNFRILVINKKNALYIFKIKSNIILSH
jgi:hypothetical protein